MVHFIDNSSSVPTLPTPKAAGTPGYFRNGVAGSLKGTDVEADWLNMVQGELGALLAAASITPSKTNNAQVLAALTTMFPGLVAAGRSVGNPGFIKLPGGLILQWLRNQVVVTDAAGAGTYTFTYPVPFTSNVFGYSYTATNEATPGNTGRVQAGNPTLTSHVVYCGGGLVSSPNGIAVSGFIIGI